MKLDQKSGPIDFIKKVGRGRTLLQDLSHAEALSAFGQLLDGRFTAAQAGAFLQALRIKELSAEELQGLYETLSGRIVRPPEAPHLAGPASPSTSNPSAVPPTGPAAAPPSAPSFDLTLNLSSDTARKGGLLSLLAAFFLEGRGDGTGFRTGVVRSEPVLSGNHGSFDRTWDLAADFFAARPRKPALASTGEFLRGYSALDPLRAELGFRSCLHTAEKLLDPFGSSFLVLGISHEHYAERLSETLLRAGKWGAVVLGNHGTVDLNLHKETVFYRIGPEGFARQEAFPPAGMVLRSDLYSLGRFGDWREGLRSGDGDEFGASLRQALLYQSAFLLFVAGKAAGLEEGIARVKGW